MRTKSIRSVQKRDMFTILVRKKVGTREVEAAARAVVGARRNTRDPKEVTRLLRRRLVEVEREMVRRRIQWQVAERKVREEVEGVEIDQYKAVMRRVEEKMKTMKTKDAKKIKWLEKKVEEKEPREKKRDFKVKDDELNEERTIRGEASPTNFTVYGDITVDEDEKDALNLGP